MFVTLFERPVEKRGLAVLERRNPLKYEMLQGACHRVSTGWQDLGMPCSIEQQKFGCRFWEMNARTMSGNCGRSLAAWWPNQQIFIPNGDEWGIILSSE
jgi:hypothetical protein